MRRDGRQAGPAMLEAADPRLDGLQLIDIGGLSKLLSMSPSTVRRHVAQGELPQPALRLGPRLIRWRLRDIQAWMDGRAVRNVT